MPVVSVSANAPHSRRRWWVALAAAGVANSLPSAARAINAMTGVPNVYLMFTSGQPAVFVSPNWFDFAH